MDTNDPPEDRHTPNPDYAEPCRFPRRDRPVPPVVEPADPAPGTARAVLTEMITNATSHGVPPAPVRFRTGRTGW